MLLDEEGIVFTHPWILGELTLGGLARREEELFRRLPTVPLVSEDEVLQLIRHRRLARRGIGWVDANLLASATQSEEVARGRYAEGVGSILDLLTAQSALADARAQHVQSRWTWYLALAQLARDVGVLSPRGDPNLAMRPDTAGRNER